MYLSDNLVIHLKPYELNYVLKRFEKYLFEYLYETSTGLFEEVKYKTIFNFKVPYKSKPVSKDIAYKLYQKIGINNILSQLKDPTLYTLYTNYSFMLKLNKSPLVSIYLKDLKILINIAQLTIDDIIQMSHYLPTEG